MTGKDAELGAAADLVVVDGDYEGAGEQEAAGAVADSATVPVLASAGAAEDAAVDHSGRQGSASQQPVGMLL